MNVWARVKSALHRDSTHDLAQDQSSEASFTSPSDGPNAERAAELSDLASDGGGQMSVVGVPYSRRHPSVSDRWGPLAPP